MINEINVCKIYYHFNATIYINILVLTKKSNYYNYFFEDLLCVV